MSEKAIRDFEIDSILFYEVKYGRDTLDKIAGDINKLKKVGGDRVYVAINDVFDVIDKYREAESEEV